MDAKTIADWKKDGIVSATGMAVEVQMPDFQTHFFNCYERIPNEMKEGESFSDALLRLAEPQIKKDKTKILQTVYIDVVELVTDERKWSDKDLQAYIKTAAVEQAVDRFCLTLMQQTAPEIRIY